MTYSKNLFFSEDEIEAVDMEIETLLLAKKRQESKSNTVGPYTAPNNAKPSVTKPVASRPATEALTSVISTAAIQSSSSVLPQQRLTRNGGGKEMGSFRINDGGETMLWPEMEPTKGEWRNAPKTRQSPSRRGWITGLALSTAMFAVTAAGFILWKGSVW